MKANFLRRHQNALLLSGLCLASVIVLVRQLALRNTGSAAEADFEQILLEREGAAKQVRYTVYTSLSCAGCAELWSALRVGHVPGYAEGMDVSVRVVPDSWSEESIRIALSLECAKVEGKFWDYADALFWDGSAVLDDHRAYASRAGLNNVPDHHNCVVRRRFLYELEARRERIHDYGSSALPMIIRSLEGTEEVVPLAEFLTTLADSTSRLGEY